MCVGRASDAEEVVSSLGSRVGACGSSAYGLKPDLLLSAVQNHLADGDELICSVDGDAVTEDFSQFVYVVRNGLQALDVDLEGVAVAVERVLFEGLPDAVRPSLVSHLVLAFRR